jgi:hypothetical protein
MNRFSVKCPSCYFPLPAEMYNTTAEHHICRSCDTKVKIYALPALYLPIGDSVETREAEMGTAACFYHETKQAEHVCDSCGRFLCGLCSLPLGNEMLCTSCLELKRENSEGSEHLIPRQTRHDKLALGLSILPALLFYPALITAPITLYIAIRYWRPRGILIRGWRIRMVIAILLALSEIAFFIFIAAMFFSLRRVVYE